jgi:hypothetical protein
MTSLEGVPQQAATAADLATGLHDADRAIPLCTVVNGTLMARRPWQEAAFALDYEVARVKTDRSIGHVAGTHTAPRLFRILPRLAALGHP